MLGASFQMSFGAVVALIAVYETGAARRPADASRLDWRLVMYVGVARFTQIASAATTPFSIYHFSRFPTYGIVTNLIAVPITGIWIMPWGMLSLLLIPVGLDAGRALCSWAMGSTSSSRRRRSSRICRARPCGASAFARRAPRDGARRPVALPLAYVVAPFRTDRDRAGCSTDAAQPAAGPSDR